MSAYGEMLYEEYLNKIGMSQRQLARESNIDPGVLNHLIAGNSAGYGKGRKCAERQYKIIRALALHMPLYTDKVQKLLQHIPEDNLPEDERGTLITWLVEDGIVKTVYLTRWLQMPLIGRATIIQEIMTMLQKVTEDEHGIRGTRFLTLVGMAGVGKSELAWQVLMEMRLRGDYFTPDPISLDNANSADDVERNISKALKGIGRQKKILLILDECEKIAEKPDAIQKIVNFINDYPNLTILATSRVFFLPSERFEIFPLKRSDAIQLFCCMAQQTNNEFRIPEQNASLVEALCIGLDRLPLAMLLAGALLNKLTVKDLHKALLDRTIQTEKPVPQLPFQERHYSLDALIRVSYDLLEPEEQMLFRRLGVFPNACSKETCISVCLDDLPADPTDMNLRDWLARLAAHHLIRFDIKSNLTGIVHHTLRDFALRELEKSEDAEKRRRKFVDYYYTLVIKHHKLRGTAIRAKRRRPSEAKATLEECGKIMSLLYEEQGNLGYVYQTIHVLNAQYVEQETKRVVGEEAYNAYKRATEEIYQAYGFRLWTRLTTPIASTIQEFASIRLMRDDRVRKVECWLADKEEAVAIIYYGVLGTLLEVEKHVPYPEENVFANCLEEEFFK